MITTIVLKTFVLVGLPTVDLLFAKTTLTFVVKVTPIPPNGRCNDCGLHCKLLGDVFYTVIEMKSEVCLLLYYTCSQSDGNYLYEK